MMANAILPPRKQPSLYGHEAIENWFLNAWKLDRLPHGLLLAGPQGSGKATFAFRAARFLLAYPHISLDLHALEIPADHPVFSRVASGGHGDLCVIGPEESQDGKNSKEITVETLRRVNHFLSQTPLEGGWRVVIIDGEMNRHAANAILKILEEPPARTLLMILTDSVGRVMPTVRSRCQTVKFGALKDQEVARIVSSAFPDVSAQDLSVIAALAEGRPGRALQLCEAGGAEVYRDLVDALSATHPFSFPKIQAFCQKYAAKPKKEDGMNFFVLTGELMEYWLHKTKDYLLAENKGQMTGTVPCEIQSFEKAAHIRPVTAWAVVWEKVTESFRQAHQFHLDRYQVLIGAFRDIVSN